MTTSSIFGCCFRHAPRAPRRAFVRFLTTLEKYPHIYVFQSQFSPDSNILSLLPTEPPKLDLAIGTTDKVPPSPDSFRENPAFLKTLQGVLSEHAHEDLDVISQAQAMASTAGANLGSRGVFFLPQRRKTRPNDIEDSSGGANGQGGAASGGRGGWIHVSDSRRPPEFGRIAWPEDIFGSLEVDSHGNFVGDKGNYQASGTYRIVTRDGILGLSPFLREKLLQKLQEQEARANIT